MSSRTDGQVKQVTAAMRFNIMVLKSLNEKCFVVRHEALHPGIVNIFSKRCNICTNNEKIRAIYLST